MELPSVRKTEIKPRFKDAVLLENILYNSKKKTNEELAKEIIEKNVISTENLKKALKRMNFDVAIEVAKIDKSFQQFVSEDIQQNPKNLFSLYRSKIVTLDYVMEILEKSKDNENQVFRILQYFVTEIKNPAEYIVLLTAEHQNQLLMHDDTDWKIFTAIRDTGYRPNSCKMYIANDDVEGLKSLLKEEKDFTKNVNEGNERRLNEEADDDLNMLDFSAKCGAEKCFEFLMENNCKITQKTLIYSTLGKNMKILNRCMETAKLPRNILTYAVRSRSFDVFDAIIAALTDEDEAVYNHEMLNAFHSSMNIGYSTFFLFFLEQNVNLQDSMFYLENELFVDSLIEMFVSPKALNSLDQTPLFVIEDFGTMEKLIKSGCDINWHDKRRKSALNSAASRGEMEKVKFLISQGADVQNEYEIIRTCIINGDFDIARVLLNSGAPIDDVASSKLYEHENGIQVDQCFSDDDDMFAVLDKTPEQFNRGKQEQISSDGYSDFDDS